MWQTNSEEKLKVILNYMEKCKIDGIISYDEELTTSKFENFTEIEPRECVQPIVETVVYGGYNEEWIYFAFKCFENNIKEIKKTLTKRDQFPSTPDDRVSIYIDTYGNLERAYVFASNPLGVQYDGIYTPEKGVDFSVDMEFETKAKIYDNFWVVEFRIPLTSIRFSSQKEQVWRIHLRRIRPRENVEVHSWAPVYRNNPSFLSQAGYLIISNFSFKERKLSVMPYIVGSFNEDKKKEGEYLFFKTLYSFLSVCLFFNKGTLWIFC